MNIFLNSIALQTTSPAMFIGTLVAVGLIILIAVVASSIDEKKEDRGQERQRVLYNSPKDIKKREADLLKKQKNQETALEVLFAALSKTLPQDWEILFSINSMQS